MNLYDLLSKYNYTITSAESCTGGLVASEIVSLSGISAFYKEGYITYAEESKTKLLDVPASLIEEKGVVSIEVAEAMAYGACKAANANCSIATTGVAGPSGGTPNCPVGTVCFGFCINSNLYHRKEIFSGDRKEIREKATQYAISTMIDLLNNQ